MTIAALASARDVGVTIGALMVPLIGLILLVVGLVERTRSQKQPPPMPSGYPAQTPPTAPSQLPHPPPYPSPPLGYRPQPPSGFSPFPPPPGAAPYPPPAGHWPPPQPKPRGTALIVAGAVILSLSLVGGIVGVAESSDTSSVGSPNRTSAPGHLDSSSLTIGECVADSDFGKGGDPKPTDCGDPRAVMELVSKGGANASCPDGKGRDDTDYTTLFWDNATMCFAANLAEGNCYAVNTSVNTLDSPFTHEDCADSRALVKVVQRLDGTTDGALCAAGTKPISYVQPARLYCLEAIHQ